MKRNETNAEKIFRRRDFLKLLLDSDYSFSLPNREEIQTELYELNDKLLSMGLIWEGVRTA